VVRTEVSPELVPPRGAGHHGTAHETARPRLLIAGSALAVTAALALRPRSGPPGPDFVRFEPAVPGDPGKAVAVDLEPARAHATEIVLSVACDPAAQTIDPGTAEELRALGYIVR